MAKAMLVSLAIALSLCLPKKVIAAAWLDWSALHIDQYTGCANKKQSPRKNAVFQSW